jgi:hypothetical protein
MAFLTRSSIFSSQDGSRQTHWPRQPAAAVCSLASGGYPCQLRQSAPQRVYQSCTRTVSEMGLSFPQSLLAERWSLSPFDRQRRPLCVTAQRAVSFTPFDTPGVRFPRTKRLGIYVPTSSTAGLRYPLRSPAVADARRAPPSAPCPTARRSGKKRKLDTSKYRVSCGTMAPEGREAVTDRCRSRSGGVRRREPSISCRWPRHGFWHRFALRLLAEDLAAKAVVGQVLFVLRGSIGRVRPDVAGGVGLVDGVRQLGADEASLEQVELAAPVHLALDEFQLGDLTLGLAIGPV